MPRQILYQIGTGSHDITPLCHSILNLNVKMAYTLAWWNHFQIDITGFR